MIDSFHSSGNSCLFHIELRSLWIWERFVLLPALISCNVNSLLTTLLTDNTNLRALCVIIYYVTTHWWNSLLMIRYQSRSQANQSPAPDSFTYQSLQISSQFLFPFSLSFSCSGSLFAFCRHPERRNVLYFKSVPCTAYSIISNHSLLTWCVRVFMCVPSNTFKISCIIYHIFHCHKCQNTQTYVLINPLKTKRRLLYLKTQSLPCSKHFSSRL